MDLPAGYRLRAPTSADLEPLSDMLIADELEDAGEVVLGAEFIRDEWSRERFDLATDAWVVADGAGTVVGYGRAMLEEPTIVDSWGIVHPEHRGRSIGSALLDRIEERAAQMLAGLESPRFRHAINAGDAAGGAMLEARGLQVVRHFWHMQMDLAGPVEPGPAPEGIEIDGIEVPDDLPAVHSVLDEAFADDWGYHPEPFDRWAEDYARHPSYDPSLWFKATERGEAVGALTANVWGDRGWVGEVGVLASHRGRGIAATLLRRSFDAFARRGLPRVILNVDAENPTGATALYERVGMRVIKRWDLWERSL